MEVSSSGEMSHNLPTAGRHPREGGDLVSMPTNSDALQPINASLVSRLRGNDCAMTSVSAAFAARSIC